MGGRWVVLDKDKLEYFREQLLKERASLLQEASKTLNEGVLLENNHIPDYADIASLESDRLFLLRLRDRERKLIRKIDQTLERIENGTFGICENCGKQIGEERLKARPVTTLCISCKTKQERQERE
jgi:DnaK suppressor protein